jgi:hypothetical protein
MGVIVNMDMPPAIAPDRSLLAPESALSTA